METLHQENDIIADRYRIVAPLGEGAFGTTYKAEKLSDRAPVAIKALSLRQIGDWKMIELFEREAKILATLNHPSIPKYLDYFHIDTPDDRLFYLVQELVNGKSLAELVKRGWHAKEKQVKLIAMQVLEILNYLHGLRPPVIHRDIKPQNIIGSPAQGKVFLVDFGAVQDICRYNLTRNGTFVGTVGYMPPEQLKGQAFFASDLYALGATLLFLLTHRSPADLPQHRMKIDFRSRLQISSEFADWLEKMLEPAVEDRFKSAREALRVLEGKSAPVAKSKKQSLFLRRKPKGSRVILRKTTQRIVMEIPPLLQNNLLGFPSYFWWFCITIILAIASYSLSGGGLSLLLLVLLGGLGLLGATTSYNLAIDSEKFRLWWKLFNFYDYNLLQGDTADIQKVELYVLVINGQTITDLVLWLAKGMNKFATSVTPIEKEWLAAEISDFLSRLR